MLVSLFPLLSLAFPLCSLCVMAFCKHVSHQLGTLRGLSLTLVPKAGPEVPSQTRSSLRKGFLIPHYLADGPRSPELAKQLAVVLTYSIVLLRGKALYSINGLTPLQILWLLPLQTFFPV